MTSKQEFLAELPIFRNLDSQAIAELAAICPEYEYDPGSVIAYQRDVADSLYIVRTGRLFSRRVDRDGIARESRAYMPGEYFDDVWLFAPGIHPATIKGTEPGRIIIIKGTDFIRFLEANPQAVRELAPKVDDQGETYGLSGAAWEDGRKLLVQTRSRDASVGLQADELLEYYAHRSGWYLFLQLIPALLLILLAPVAYLLLPEGVGLVRIFRWLVPSLLLLVGLAMIVFRWLDWRNDYFVITNKHLLHREFNLRSFQINLVKIPVGQVQTVEIDKPSFINNLFDIGSARVTTASNVGMVMFDHIDDPILVKQTLDRLSGRVRTLNAAQEFQVMRQSLEDHFEIDPQLREVVADSEEPDEAPAPTNSRRGLFGLIHRLYGWRVIEGNVITYRKSIFVLLRLVLWPVLGFIALVLIGWILIKIGFPSTIVILIMAFLILIDFAGMVWQVEDWRNDTFQVTDRAVLDIDRRPFGFGETRKQAAISNIQNVTAERPGFFPTIFNYGNVKIDTAGAQADIMFDHVPNPSVIQSDIFERLDNFRNMQRVRDGRARRQEYAILLDVYSQAVEENRIPRRMPEDLLDEEEIEEV
ncbi:MAG: cyclic nucleotide-binding domain-containing protein [Chloroflexota bacterium]